MKKIILSVILILLVFSLYGLEFDDYVIATAPALKVLLPIGMIPEMFIDSDSIIPGAIGLGLFTIPNSFLLYNVFTENPVGTSFWRKVTLYSDAAVGLSLAGSGIYLLAGGSFGGDGWDQLVGGLFVVMSTIVFGAVGADMVPYSFEY
ncbi:MAG: hypothetical protein KAR21_22715 [Spirochaetales bacterium]|nr:hypothetical protein [Spirochaetales bacterium]